MVDSGRVGDLWILSSGLHLRLWLQPGRANEWNMCTWLEEAVVLPIGSRWALLKDWDPWCILDPPQNASLARIDVELQQIVASEGALTTTCYENARCPFASFLGPYKWGGRDRPAHVGLEVVGPPAPEICIRKQFSVLQSRAESVR